MNIFAFAVTVAFIMGIGLAAICSLPVTLWYILGLVCSIAFLGGIRQRRAYTVGILCGIFLIAGALRFIGATTLPADDISHYQGQVLLVHGTVSELPQVTGIDSLNKVRYIIKVNTIQNGRNKLSASGYMSLSTRQKADAAVAGYGDSIAVYGKVVLPHGYHNPGLPDIANAMARQGITAMMAERPEHIKVFPAAASLPWDKKLTAWREQKVAAMCKVMSGNDAAVLSGILFGGYKNINPDVIHNFITSGIIYILCVSGLHVALVAAAICYLGEVCRLPRRIVSIIVATAMMLYCAVAGFTPPVVRATVMALITMVASVFGREADTPSALAWTALGMLAYQPLMLFDIGFQLSFSAVAGLIFLYRKTKGVLKSVLPEWVAGNLAISIAAQLGMLPFLAWYFNTFSLVGGFLANLVIIPVVEVILVLGLLGTLAGSVSLLAGTVLFIASSQLIGLVIHLAEALSSLPGALVYLPAVGLAGGTLYYLVIAWVYGYHPQTVPSFMRMIMLRPRQVLAVSMIIGVAVLLYARYPQPLAVHFIDVGQGDSTLIITPHGRAVLIDTGGAMGETDFDVGDRVVVPYLRHYGVQQLDFLILTHGHQDHAGGAAAIAAAMPVHQVMLAREAYSPAVQRLVHTMQGKGIVVPTYTGQDILLDDVRFKVIHAVGGAQLHPGNEVSSVVQIEYGQHRFLVTGDLEADGEQVIVEQGVSPCTVLKVGHHGANTSSTPAFLQAVSPQYAVISVGYNNHFGHPHPAVLQRLALQHCRVFRTDLNGAVLFQSDGRHLKISTYSES